MWTSLGVKNESARVGECLQRSSIAGKWGRDCMEFESVCGIKFSVLPCAAVDSTREFATMSLACLACHAMEHSTDSFRMDQSFRLHHSVSVHSDDGREGCGGLSGCFSKKPTHRHSTVHHQASTVSPRTPPQGGLQATSGRVVFPEPRLTRCHAVRRDIFSNWTVGEMEAEAGRQLCFNMSSRA
ncbi:hypothetical protein R1sor_024469 [Riccia sorocarpa]|uniref:Uncharacterized protein n=1 Tax=Riccia sorocarpa TaxID=122646 RepID=A0ABD3GQN5_9MARC